MDTTDVVEPSQKPAPVRQSAAPFCVGDPIPTTLGSGDLARVLNLPEPTFYQYQKEGKFKRFEFRRPFGAKKYSGALVKRFLETGQEVA